MFREVIYLSYLLIQYRMRFEVGAEKSSLWKTLSPTILEKGGEGEAKRVFNSLISAVYPLVVSRKGHTPEHMTRLQLERCACTVSPNPLEAYLLMGTSLQCSAFAAMLLSASS